MCDDLERFRADLARALREHDGDGPLRRDLLEKHRITRETAASAYRLEWMRKIVIGIYPNMDPSERVLRSASW